MTSKSTTLVGVYGSLRKGLVNHNVLKGSKQIGDYLTAPEYTMYDLGFYPGLIDKGFTPIVLEIYEVNDNVLGNINTLEGYSEHSKEQSYYIPKTIKTPFGEVMIYIYNDSITNPVLVKDGDWLEYYNAIKTK